MRVYTNQTLVNLWAYAKFVATLAVLFVILSQAAKFFANEPAIQQLRELTEKVQSK